MASSPLYCVAAIDSRGIACNCAWRAPVFLSVSIPLLCFIPLGLRLHRRPTWTLTGNRIGIVLLVLRLSQTLFTKTILITRLFIDDFLINGKDLLRS